MRSLWPGFMALVKMVRDLAPTTPIILLGNMWLPATPSCHQQFQDNFSAKYGSDGSWAHTLIALHGCYTARHNGDSSGYGGKTLCPRG